MKIGLLEDNPAICDLITTALELVDHTVVSYTYGTSFLEALFAKYNIIERSLPYDLLIVDLSLPGELSGLAVINHIHETLVPLTLPIIVISGAGQHELDIVYKRYPIIPVLRKPFSIKTLLDTIAKQHCIANGMLVD